MRIGCIARLDKESSDRMAGRPNVRGLSEPLLGNASWSPHTKPCFSDVCKQPPMPWHDERRGYLGAPISRPCAKKSFKTRHFSVSNFASDWKRNSENVSDTLDLVLDMWACLDHIAAWYSCTNPSVKLSCTNCNLPPRCVGGWKFAVGIYALAVGIRNKEKRSKDNNKKQ